MPMPTDYRIGVPDISPALSTIAGAIEGRRERKRLSEIGGMIQGGNLSGAAGAAFGQGDLQTGVDLTKMDQDRQAKIGSILANAARQADDPQKWSQFIDVVGKRFPGANLDAYRDFDSRGLVLAEFPSQEPEFKIAAPGSSIVASDGSIIGTAPGRPMSVSPGASLYDPASNEFVATAPAKPQGAKNLPATAMKELFEADESVSAGQGVISALDRALEINDKAYSGWGADTRGYAMSIFGSDAGESTQELQNIVTSQALDQLKAVFGSMPTEGERKILLEMQGSVNQAPAVRKKIWERAKQAAERRIDFNRKKAEGIRSGEYFGPEGSPTGPETPFIPEPIRDPAEIQGLLDQANEAIAQGADTDEVIARLRDMGVELVPE